MEISEYEYDSGGIGDGNMTKQNRYPGGSAPARVAQTWYDWRNRAVAQKAGVELSESTSVNRPITYTQYNNLGQAVAQELYDGDGVSIVDANFNVTGLVDTSRTVVERYVYDPFGAVTLLNASWVAASGNYDWIYLHQGGRLDTVSDLYHFRNRDYSPTLGRWTRNDPIGYDAGDVNLFRYIGNGVTGSLDPMGLDRYRIGFSASGELDPTEHSRIAVDTWKCKDGKYIKTGQVTFELGSKDDGRLLLLGFRGARIYLLESIQDLTAAIHPFYFSLMAITITNGLHNDKGSKKVETIKSSPKADISLLRKLMADAETIHIYHNCFNNCHRWVARRIDYGMDEYPTSDPYSYKCEESPKSTRQDSDDPGRRNFLLRRNLLFGCNTLQCHSSRERPQDWKLEQFNHFSDQRKGTPDLNEFVKRLLKK